MCAKSLLDHAQTDAIVLAWKLMAENWNAVLRLVIGWQESPVS